MAGLCTHQYLTPTRDSYYNWNRGKVCNRVGHDIRRRSDRASLLDYTWMLTNPKMPQRGGYRRWPQSCSFCYHEDCTEGYGPQGSPREEPVSAAESIASDWRASCPNVAWEEERARLADLIEATDTFKRCTNRDPNGELPVSEYTSSYCRRFWESPLGPSAADSENYYSGRPVNSADPTKSDWSTTHAHDFTGDGPGNQQPPEHHQSRVRQAAPGDGRRLGKSALDVGSSFTRCMHPDPTLTFPDSEYTSRYCCSNRNPGCNVYGVEEDVYTLVPDTKTRHAGCPCQRVQPCTVHYHGVGVPAGERCCCSPGMYERVSSPLECFEVADGRGDVVGRPVLLDHSEGYAGCVPLAFRREDQLFGNRVADRRGNQLGSAVQFTHGTNYFNLQCPHQGTKDCIYSPKCCRTDCKHCQNHCYR